MEIQNHNLNTSDKPQELPSVQSVRPVEQETKRLGISIPQQG